MNKKSMDRLAGFLSEAIESKISSKSKMDLLTDEFTARAFNRTLTTKNLLIEANKSGQLIDDEIIQYVNQHLAQKSQAATSSWNIPELHLVCDFISVTEDEDENMFTLVYTVDIKDLKMRFFCCADSEVYDFSLRSENQDCIIDDVWKYYAQHTPCAIT